MRLREGDKGQDILRAAIEVIANDGYHSAKISKIAERAGVSSGTVYLYYDNKESLLHAILDRLWQNLASELTRLMQLPELTALEKLDGAVDLFFDTCAANPSLAIVFVNEQALLLQRGTGTFVTYYNAFLEHARELIRQGIENGTFNPHLDLKVMHHFILGGLRSLVHEWARNPQEFPLGNVRQAVKYFIKNGLLRQRIA